MKKILFLLISTVSIHCYSQSHEIFVGAGIANYYGDLNTNNANSSFFSLFSELDLKYAHGSYSGGYRYNFKNMFSVGLSGHYFVVDGADHRNNRNSPGERNFFRYTRNLSFKSDVIQGIIDARIEPWRVERRWVSGNFLFSPYVGVGLSLFHFNPKTTLNGVDYDLQQYTTEGQVKYGLTQFAIPLQFGMKFFPANRFFSVNLHFNYTFTFTDYVDDVSTEYADPAILGSSTAIALADRRPEIDPTNKYWYVTQPGAQRGNSKNNDNFLTSQIQISFYLNRSTSEPYYKCCKF